MTPRSCYRFGSCNSPVCPLEPEAGCYAGGEESVCRLAALAAKGAVPPRHSELGRMVLAGLPRVAERYPAVGRLLARAAGRPPKAPGRPAHRDWTAPGSSDEAPVVHLGGPGVFRDQAEPELPTCAVPAPDPWGAYDIDEWGNLL